jgi:alpha,alpha-trehalose phosphorylase
MPQAEAGYGYPELGQTLVNVTNGKIIRLLVDDEPFDVRYGRLRAQRDYLDDFWDRADVELEGDVELQQAARVMLIPYDEALGVHPQDEQFTEHAVWDFARTGPDQYPLMLHFHYFDLYRKQVVKQADLVLALYLRGDAFSPEDKARTFEYYEPLTVRDSSLSSFVQAVVAAAVGNLELAYDYLGEAALLDLGDLHHNSRDGVHLASLAGAWIAGLAAWAITAARSASLPGSHSGFPAWPSVSAFAGAVSG